VHKKDIPYYYIYNQGFEFNLIRIKLQSFTERYKTNWRF